MLKTEGNMNTDNTAAAGEPFNYAGWLLEQNPGRGHKTAYIDDQGTLSYADLDARAREASA
jgi:benzoate-CoA ligase